MVEDGMRKELLIIKDNPTSILSVENYLKIRGWEIMVATEIESALNLWLAKTPPYVMIPVDHPDKRFEFLPSLLTKSFSCCVLHFVEHPSLRTLRMLKSLSSDYVLSAPVSGVSIERLATKYLRQIRTRQLKSGKKLPSYYMVTRENGQELEALTESQIKIKGGVLLDILNRSSAEMQDESSNPVLTLDAGGANDIGHDEPASSLRASKHRESKSQKRRRNTDHSRKGSKEFREAKESSRESSNESKDYYSFFKTKASQSLADLTDQNSSAEVVGLGIVSNVACIIVDSVRYKGYLVVATGKNRPVNKDLLSKIRLRLISFLGDDDKIVTEREIFDLTIKPVAFEPWTEQCAQFLVKSIHNGESVAMAFMPRPDIHFNAGTSPSEDMVALSLEYFAEDAVSDFNIYLYMPQNKKYLLYNQKGTLFHNNRRDRLREKGVTHLHIKRTDVPLFKKYRIATHLNSEIRFHLDDLKNRQEETKDQTLPDVSIPIAS